MKKVTLIFLLFLSLGMLQAQINLEEEFNHSGTFVNLSNSGYKFYLMDVVAEQCRIYNTDYSLWKTLNLNVPDNHYLYDIRFVSENLFTNDNTLSLCYIYYNYDEVNLYYTYTAVIMNESGSILLTIPGAQYVYANNLGDEGAKLTAYSYDYSIYPSTIKTLVYDLPGTLVSNAAGQQHENVLADAYPNPATGYTILPYSLPADVSAATLIVNDASGKVIQSYPVDRQFEKLRINTAQMPKGFYLYHIEAGAYRSEARKIIVN
jgi:hypothetical protein